MSKPTETTNERVPRDIVRIGTTVGKRWEAHGSTRKHTEAWGSAWVARRTVAEPCGRGDEGVPKGCRNVRDARNERTRGVGLDAFVYYVKHILARGSNTIIIIHLTYTSPTIATYK
jgi:hypothetical protein